MRTTPMKSRSVIFGAAALACAACVSAGAMAQAPQDSEVAIHTRTVRFDRAAAGTAAGAQDLYGTLDRTASRVCEDNSEPLAASLHDESYAKCRDDALARAVASVGVPALTAVYERAMHEPLRRGTVSPGD